MKSLQDLIREKEREKELNEKGKVVQKEKDKLKKLKENGKAITKELEKRYPLINFQKLSETSDFKRLIYYAISGKTHRGTKDNLESELSKMLNKVQE